MKHIPAITTLAALLFTGCATAGHRDLYEYRVYHAEKLAKDVENDINQLAKEGWRVHSFGMADNGNHKYVVLERRRTQ